MGILKIVPLLLLSIHGTLAVWTLRKIGTMYIPSGYGSTAQDLAYTYDGGAANSVAYNHKSGYAYVGGDNYVHVVDYSRLRRPDIVAKVASSDGPVTDIATCGYLVAWVARGGKITDPGVLHVYDSYKRVSKSWQMLCTAQVGSNPISLKFFHQCNTIVIANKGTAAEDQTAGVFNNPEGTVSIVRLHSTKGNQPPFQPPTGPMNPPVRQDCGAAAPFVMEITTIDFKRFNDPNFAPLLSAVRTPYDGALDGNKPTFSQAVEPHYVTEDPMFNSAFISLRENNAVLQLNLEIGNESVSAINPLGTKDWSSLNLDPTNMPQAGATFGRYNIHSLRQPGAIQPFEYRGPFGMTDTYLITADEGATTTYSYQGVANAWSDAAVGATLQNAPEHLRQMLQNPNKLGKLEVSKVDGKVDPMNPQSPLQNVNFFGSRGISLFKFNLDSSDLEHVWDSGDIISTAVQEFFPQVFNGLTSTTDSQSFGPASLADMGSMKRGAQCKSLAIGDMNENKLVFVGVDGPSVIAIFSISSASRNVTPTFESVYRHGAVEPEYSILMERKKLGDVDPAKLQFISANHTVDRKPYLMVLGKKSGTVTMYRVVNEPRNIMIARLRKESSGNGAVAFVRSLSVVFTSFVFAALVSLM